ncbi:hypothetical protein DPMN_171325 [Dreissena polymorpha]|uniref:Uncharacterized protein n=1 Tax=Dreissena polymorpha TaxID=45954 RepID=A0A9D4ICB2_DREPO|nr:hypothetical protein DPMN_171325 [Dreissena polymorpha]
MSGNTMKMASKDTEVVENWPTPTCAKDVERFLRFANYYRSFVKGFSDLATSLVKTALNRN